MEDIENKTWVSLTKISDDNIMQEDFQYQSIGLYEFNYSWSYDQITIQVSMITNFPSEKIRFFDSNGKIVTMNDYMRLDELDSEKE